MSLPVASAVFNGSPLSRTSNPSEVVRTQVPVAGELAVDHDRSALDQSVDCGVHSRGPCPRPRWAGSTATMCSFEALRIVVTYSPSAFS